MKKSTSALQLLIDTINKFPELATKEWISQQCEELKHEEKKQIIDAVVWFDKSDRNSSEIEKEAEQYYNCTYGSPK